MQKWKNKELDNGEAWYLLYTSLADHKKHLFRRYSSISGSRYVITVSSQLMDEVITPEDLEGLSEPTKQWLLKIRPAMNQQ